MEKPDTLILTEKDRIADTLDESVALWSGLTDELGLAVTGEGITAEEKEVIDNTSSGDQLAVLNKLYREVQSLDTPEQKKEYILRSKPLCYLLVAHSESRDKWDLLEQLG